MYTASQKPRFLPRGKVSNSFISNSPFTVLLSSFST
jgi:hypothetical protein